MCVYDPMTNSRSFFSFPPDINTNPLLSRVYRYVLLTAAAGIGCAFMVLAADMTSLQDCGSRIHVQATVSSLSDARGFCQWGPMSSVYHNAPMWSMPLDGHNAAVVAGGVVHWVMIESQHILAYDVATGEAWKMGLPFDDDRDRMASSDGKKLTVLFAREFKVLVWEGLPGEGYWRQQATIDVEASVRPLLPDIELFKSENFKFRDFGDPRSGAVLLQYPHYVPSSSENRFGSHHHELLVLNMDTKEMRRIIAGNTTGITYEVDLASRLSAMKVY